MGRRLASDLLREGELPRGKARPLPDEFGGDGDWLAFEPERKPAPIVQIEKRADQGDSLGVSAADWSEASSKPHPAPPPGSHICVVRSAWSHQPKSGGPKVLAMVWEVLEGPHQGKTVWQALGLHARQEAGRRAAIGWLRRIWEAAGCDPSRLPTKPEDLAGLVCRVTVSHRPHWANPGEVVAVVQGVSPAPEV